MVREMTKGKPLSLIIGFCIPMLLGNIFQQLYSMVDTIIVGQFIGVDALAAVGATGSVNFLVIGFAMGITSGCCIPIAQSFGARNHSEMRKYVANAVYICAGVTVILTALTLVFTRQILQMMQTPEEIIDMAYSYIIVIFGGIISTVVYNLLAGILRALGDSKTPLYFLALASIINIGLDLLLIIVFNMGVAGAGWATVISQSISGICCYLYIKKRYVILGFEKGEFSFEVAKIAKLARIGIPMALQFSITAVGSIILQRAVNGLGTSIIAAVTGANKLQMLVVQPMETLGITMATYCGQNLGAGKVDRIKKGINQSLIVGISYSFVAMATMWLFSGPMMTLFVDAAEISVIENATYFLRINAIFYPVLAVLFLLRNSLQGLGFSLLPMMAGVGELIARSVVAFGFVSILGYNAICFAAPSAWFCATVLLVFAYISKIKYLNKKFLPTPAAE